MKLQALVLILLISLGWSPAQTDVFQLKYDMTVTYIPEIVNTRKVTMLVSEEFVHYDVDYTSPPKGAVPADSKIILAEQVNKKDYYSKILFNLNSNLLIENRFDRRGTKKFLSIKEDIPQIKWNILNETKQISGYICKVATTKFRGRNYYAYFTEQIPISYGPWKFNGLPGLIISISDDDNIYRWDLKSVKKKDSMDKQLKKFNEDRSKFKNVSYEEFDRNRIELRKKRLKLMKARGGQRGNMFVYSFSTEQWLEPSNEFRSQTDFSL